MASTKKTAIRTTTPFDGGLSPISDKSKGVPLFGGTPLIQDLLKGENDGFNDIKGRGAWSSEPNSQTSYRSPGDEFRLDETLRQLDIDRAKGKAKNRGWVAEMEDGSRYEFPSKDVANNTLKMMGKPFRRLFQRKAADTGIVSSIVSGCVGVMSKSGNGGGIGAAFCIAPNKFLTCAHVVDSYAIGVDFDDAAFMAKNISIEIKRDGQAVPAKLVAVNLRLDIALLEANLPSSVLVLSDSRNYAQGEPVVVVGSPKGFENEVSEGIVGGVDRVVFIHKGAPRHVFTDAKILPGNSGGPLVSMSDGKVIGMIEIIVGKDAPYGLNAAIETEYLDRALKEMGVNIVK